MRIGLTGGIGSGKSEVSRRLAERGAVVIDADQIAREVVEPGTEGLAEIVAAFGSEILRPDGALDRPKLGSIVFSDPAKLEILNGIVHPKVGARVQQVLDETPSGGVIVYDVPLLAENNLAPTFDQVIVVDTDDEIRIRRLGETRGMSEPDARARIAAQASREDRLAVADTVIDNNGTVEDLDRQIDELWARLTSAQQMGT